MESPPAASPEGLRDHAMLELFYSSGLRLAELVGLDARFADADGYRSAGWLKLDSAEVEVLGKGNRRRVVPVGSKALEALSAWLAVRDQMVKHDPHPLFLSVRGNRLSPNVVRERVKRAALVAGIPAERASARAAAFVRHARAAVERRSARRAGTARPRQHHRDAGLHRARFPASRARLRSGASARQKTRLTPRLAACSLRLRLTCRVR